MKLSKKITYTASAAAIAAVCILVARFLPLNFVPLMAAAVCFFIALQCGFVYGLLCMAASMLLTFFWSGLDIAILFTLFLFAPYSIVAFFIQRLSYKKPLQAVGRIAAVVVLFNAALAAIVFGFLDIAGTFLFGFDLASMLDFLGGMPAGYIILATVGSVLMAGFDIMFTFAWDILNKRLKIKPQKVNQSKADKTDTEGPNSTDDPFSTGEQ